MKANPIKFGTDGWRAVIAEDFTFDNVRICAQASADYLKQAGLAARGMAIGYDTRFASERFAAAAAEVLAANGIKVYLCPKPTPTPVLSYGIVSLQAGGGIIITASHNPGEWSGFKYKSEDGASASTEVIAELEKHVSRRFPQGEMKRVPMVEALKKGLVQYEDLAPVYVEQVARLVDIEAIRRSGLLVVNDSMYGAGIGYFRRCLRGGTLKLVEMNGRRNPLFPGIRPEPIMPHLSKLARRVKGLGASVGLATDGDADRVGIMDERGEFITQLQTFALLALYFLEVRGERGPMIKTLTSGAMLYKLGKLYNVPVYDTPVGFKYVAPLMMEKDAFMGGEESGGYGFRGHVPERDGILAGLFFLDFMVKTGKAPSQLLDYLYSKVGPHYYKRVDFPFDPGTRQLVEERLNQNRPGSIEGTKVGHVDTRDGFHYLLTDGSWLLIRFSGTEPLIRVYAESDSLARVDRMLEVGKELLGVGK
ncbi:MAG: phosphoglucomutase/phosphomannomutase family protein [Dehalococcoidia bacterium]|nr:phosphoglucomutase/phosphomannomutase family protein [Dehalococcoidia bacterium]